MSGDNENKRLRYKIVTQRKKIIELKPIARSNRKARKIISGATQTHAKMITDMNSSK